MSSGFDLVIAGGGPTGEALALAVARECNARIALVETQPAHQGLDEANWQQQSRVVALAKGSSEFLAAIGAWQTLKPFTTPIRHIKVSDRGHMGQCHLDASEYDIDALGHVTPLNAITAALQRAQPKGLTRYQPNYIEQVSQNREQLTLGLQDGQQLHTKLLVIAEGAQSATRSLMGIGVSEQSYQQVALVANVVCSQPHEFQAFERFTEQGPLALLPHGDRQMSVVWTLHEDQQASIVAMDNTALLAKLQRAFGYQLGQFSHVGPRVFLPLILYRSEAGMGHRTLLLGNCAQSLHPIAGQGLNLALRDVKAAAQGLSEAIMQGDDPGRFSVLDGICGQRQPDRQATISLTDALVRVFSNNHLPLVVGRNLGLITMNWLPGLKRQLARQTLGRYEQ